MKLSWDQRKDLADFANMIAAAWFTAGVISPMFTRPKTLGEFLLFLLIGLGMTGIVLFGSLYILRR